MKTETKKEAARVRALRYARSEKGMAQNKKWRESNSGKLSHAKAVSKNRSANREKTSARDKIGYAVRYGKLVKPTECESCGDECNPHGHHADYSKPLEVQWLCAPCHAQEHLRLREVA